MLNWRTDFDRVYNISTRDLGRRWCHLQLWNQNTCDEWDAVEGEQSNTITIQLQVKYINDCANNSCKGIRSGWIKNSEEVWFEVIYNIQLDFYFLIIYIVPVIVYNIYIHLYVCECVIISLKWWFSKQNIHYSTAEASTFLLFSPSK